ncbi:UNVERIFIED_CONTAM: Poldip2 [Trichonephila clavipes]
MMLFQTQWRYCIRLENLGDLTVQLRERYWRIFSLSGSLETVRGRGVVGQVLLSLVLNSFCCFITKTMKEQSQYCQKINLHFNIVAMSVYNLPVVICGNILVILIIF